MLDANTELHIRPFKNPKWLYRRCGLCWLAGDDDNRNILVYVQNPAILKTGKTKKDRQSPSSELFLRVSLLVLQWLWLMWLCSAPTPPFYPHRARITHSTSSKIIKIPQWTCIAFWFEWRYVSIFTISQYFGAFTPQGSSKIPQTTWVKSSSYIQVFWAKFKTTDKILNLHLKITSWVGWRNAGEYVLYIIPTAHMNILPLSSSNIKGMKKHGQQKYCSLLPEVTTGKNTWKLFKEPFCCQGIIREDFSMVQNLVVIMDTTFRKIFVEVINFSSRRHSCYCSKSTA